MSKKILIALVLVVFVILVAGCVKKEASNQNSAPQLNQSSQEIVNQNDQQQTYNTSVECTTNLDCDDGNPCTTDSCINGQCSYVKEADCQFVETQKPSISKIQYTGNEYVEITAKNWDVSNWKIEDGAGNVFYKFPDKFKLNNYLIIYSGNGISTSTEKYAGVGDDFWNDQSGKVVLVAANGTVVSEKTY